MVLAYKTNQVVTVSDKEVIKPFGPVVSIVCHSSQLSTTILYPELVGNGPLDKGHCRGGWPKKQVLLFCYAVL